MGNCSENAVYFEAALLDREVREYEVDIQLTPYFYNDAGRPSYLASLPDGLKPLALAPENRKSKGNKYLVPRCLGTKDNAPYGIETQLEFKGTRFEFEALWATRENAAAFGFTLVEAGQAIQIQSPVTTLSQIEYEYGLWASYWCPYLDLGLASGRGKTLFPFICTDMEHHDFPHVFASSDANLPLVISVARYWPKQKKIYLADLWVPIGSALYLPPQPAHSEQEYINLHNNRNSAHACWGSQQQTQLKTHTLLQNQGGYFYWYWNKSPTIHHLSPVMK
ncbi:hypothetical protein E0H82_12485 [Acinetobacter sp. ANC 4910]|uniref:hypothetical protein n=1 Tax=Acinetobacter sp. ANC 4910 TaxID=2529850 RepID=UPI00103F2BC2|nr:hypothetical protein [Acinetobacter sp. ANC 4910]TCB33948.1 hypothetical protein E0H82_12485 [Acinetobacter sp. ANC 4910]